MTNGFEFVVIHFLFPSSTAPAVSEFAVRRLLGLFDKRVHYKYLFVCDIAVKRSTGAAFTSRPKLKKSKPPAQTGMRQTQYRTIF